MVEVAESVTSALRIPPRKRNAMRFPATTNSILVLAWLKLSELTVKVVPVHTSRISTSSRVVSLSGKKRFAAIATVEGDNNKLANETWTKPSLHAFPQTKPSTLLDPQ